MGKLLKLIILLGLFACGPAHDLKKADRLIKRAIAHGAIIKADTVFVDKEIQIPGEKTTITIPGITRLRDTTIYQDRIKIHYQLRHDTLKEFIECPDTVFIVKEALAVNNQIICPPKDNRWKWIAISLFALIVVAITINSLKQ